MTNFLRRFTLTAFVLFGGASAAIAQTATAGNHFAFDLVGQALSVASAAQYNAYLDASAGATPLTGITCSTGSVANATTCLTNIPPLTAGAHSVAITEMVNSAESGKSTPLNFTFVAVVTPTNVRIARLLGFWKGGVLTSRGRLLAVHRQYITDLRRVE